MAFIYSFLLLLFFLPGLSPGYAQQPLSSLSPCLYGVNVLTGQLNEDVTTPELYEPYQEGWNHLGEQSVFLDESDSRIGKVKMLNFSSLDGSSFTIYFSYDCGETRVWDSSGRMSCYRYADLPMVESVEHYRENALGLVEPSCAERYLWQRTPTDSRLLGWRIESFEGEELLKCDFSYGDKGELVKVVLEPSKGYDGRIVGQEGSDNGSCSVSYHYSNENSQLIAGQVVEVFDANGENITIDCNSRGEPLDTQATRRHSSSEDLSGLSDTRYQRLQRFFKGIWNAVAYAIHGDEDELQFSFPPSPVAWHDELQLPQEVGNALETIGKALIGESVYLLLGPYVEETHVGVCGQTEISDRVRVTFINGVLTTANELVRALNILSTSHGGVRVHYVFRPTAGWTWDISNGILIKTGLLLAGFRSAHAHLLAKMWRELIQEMGGVEGGGTIVHYAHSLGGTETDRARELLSPEEQKMICVTTFGSATLVRDGGFRSVLNVVSTRDGVSYFDPLEYIRSCFSGDSNVRFENSLLGSPYLPIDHLLNGPTYGSIIKAMGEQFLSEFGSG